MRVLPNIKLSGLNNCPNGPDLTESIVPGSKSSKIALGTYLPPESDKNEKFQTKGKKKDMH